MPKLTNPQAALMAAVEITKGSPDARDYGGSSVTGLASHFLGWLDTQDEDDPKKVEEAGPLDRRLLTPDPNLMASPEGDFKGLQELRDA